MSAVPEEGKLQRLPARSGASLLREWDCTEFRAWHDRGAEIAAIAGPIYTSPAFERLGAITFLGILSPRFAEGPGELPKLRGDGSRRSHSLGVALLNLDMARDLGFSETSQRYAAVWGLLHDIGNWPLSHTAEYAFSRLTRRTTRELRREIVTGAKAVPSEYSLHRQVVAAGLDVDCVLALLDHRTESLTGELRELAHLLTSPLVPDGFEGMWRCGRVLGVDVPRPELLARTFTRDAMRTVRIRRGAEAQALEFWRAKAHIYRSFLNRPDIVQRESAWAQAVLRDFSNLDLEGSLYLSEDDVVRRVTERGLPSNVSFSRYKEPVSYWVNLPERESLPRDATLEQVATIFVARRVDNRDDEE